MSDITTIDQLLQNASVPGPADEELIRSAEGKLGILFPVSYRAFLARYGAALGEGFGIAGLFESDKTNEPPLWSDVVTNTIQMRRASHGQIPNEYIPISDDGGDFIFYLDTAKTRSDKECPVVVLGPGADGIVVACDFVEFVHGLSTGRLTF